MHTNTSAQQVQCTPTPVHLISFQKECIHQPSTVVTCFFFSKASARERWTEVCERRSIDLPETYLYIFVFLQTTHHMYSVSEVVLFLFCMLMTLCRSLIKKIVLYSERSLLFHSPTKLQVLFLQTVEHVIFYKDHSSSGATEWTLCEAVTSETNIPRSPHRTSPPFTTPPNHPRNLPGGIMAHVCLNPSHSLQH